MSKSVLLAMSGGIDSSAAAVLLKKAGYEVHGLTFRIEGVSSSVVDNAEEICKKLKIPHEYIDITDTFKKNVIEYFKCEYISGRTPNPCIMCNKKIKFGYIFNLAFERGFDFVATGHYATIKNESGRYYLEKSIDESRDQTYFLYVLKETQLERILFPLNGIPKLEARKICSEENLLPRDAGESREICFIPDDYKTYLEQQLNITIEKGNFINKEGTILGKHEGLHRYTVGQRKGLGLNMGEPAFITKLDPISGDITIGREDELFTDKILIENVNLINGSIPQNSNFYVKIRYGKRDYEVESISLLENEKLIIKLHKPARAVTSGQSAVIYQDNRVVGGGTIK